jgi:hypothetical protein
MTTRGLLGTFDTFAVKMPNAGDRTIDCDIGSVFTHLNGTGTPRTYTINNFKGGRTLSVLISGAANDVINFTINSDSGTGSLTVKYGAGQNGTMASAFTLFTFLRPSDDTNWVLVSPIHGIP